MANNFFKHGDKGYVENLNDSILLGNSFDWTIEVSLPTDTEGVFPSSSDVVKAKVCDASITPNSNLSIGSTISNSSGSSQTYRLTVYPNFNRYGGFKSISLTADTGVTFYIANKGGNSPIVNNLDYSDLGNVPELKVLKEYDIVITVPNGKSVSGLSFVLQSASADVYGSIRQSNVTGLSTALDSKVNVSDIKDNLTSTDTDKPLSANMGKSLKTSLDSIDTKFGWIDYSNDGSKFSCLEGANAHFEVNTALRLAHLYFEDSREYHNGANPVPIMIHDDYLPNINVIGVGGVGGFIFIRVPSKTNSHTLEWLSCQNTSGRDVTTTIGLDTVWKY